MKNLSTTSNVMGEVFEKSTDFVAEHPKESMALAVTAIVLTGGLTRHVTCREKDKENNENIAFLKKIYEEDTANEKKLLGQHLTIAVHCLLEKVAPQIRINFRESTKDSRKFLLFEEQFFWRIQQTLFMRSCLR